MNLPLSPTLLNVVKAGNSAGIVLPEKMLGRLGVTIGDALTASIAEDSAALRRSDYGFEAQSSVSRKLMERRERALR